MRIFDAKYKPVAEIDEGMKEAGTYELDINAEKLSDGMYFYNLCTEDQIMSKCMIKTSNVD